MDYHVIPMTAVEPNSFTELFRSRFVYRGWNSSVIRINVWDNTGRPNRRNGEPIRWGQCGPLDGGDGLYLDPHNEATDAETSILITPEATVISAHGDGTGTEASGQVYAEQAGPLRSGDILRLTFPDGSVLVRVVRMTNNGHGVAD